MPGSLSNLDRHEWLKHGTCYGTDAETYYRHALALLDQLNASAVRSLFADRLGRSLGAREIRTGFDRAFGRGTGERVQVSCDDGMITELRLGMSGRVSESASLTELMRAAAPVSAGCRLGRVDAPGPD
jgi:ribonuclease T2